MDIEKTVRSLAGKGYKVSCFDTAAEAAAYLDKNIDGVSVGCGDSVTLRQLGLYELLKAHNSVISPPHEPNFPAFLDAARRCLTADVFLTSVSAIAETGELVNIDGTGHRVAGSLFGHKKVWFIAGTNKITPTLDEAVRRAKYISAPLNAKRKGKKTPCAVTGVCSDCSAPERICNGLMIHLHKMSNIEMEVVLIDEELGL